MRFRDRVDVEMHEAPLLGKLAHKLQCCDLQRAIAAERERREYNFKRARKGGTQNAKRSGPSFRFLNLYTSPIKPHTLSRFSGPLV